MATELSCSKQLATKVEELRGFHPRETGNNNHARFVKYIAKQLEGLGLVVNTDTLRFNRWELGCCKLTVQGSGVDVASAYPYSGGTPSTGVTGPLQLFSWWHRWKDNTGKIAVIKVPNPSVPISLLLDDVGHPANASDLRNFPRTYPHPVLSATVFGPDLAAAKAARTIGVVAVWKEKQLTAAQANAQYVPFTFPYQDIPAVWVAGKEGKQILDSARRRESATLTLDATVSREAPTHTVWAVVKGEVHPDETILVVTHTDGGNDVEENGAIGVLDLVRKFASERPKRTLVFVFVTGHLRSAIGNQATTEWLNAHPERWSGKKKAVAGLVIEHLGALETQRRSDGGQVEPAVQLIYATNSKMQDTLRNSWTEKMGKVLIARPAWHVHFGEGEPLYKRGIPTIALASVPKYLLATNVDDHVDSELMYEQIGVLACALRALDDTPKEQLGRAELVSCTSKLRSFVQFLLFIALNPTLVFHLSAFVKAARREDKTLLTFESTRPGEPKRNS